MNEDRRPIDTREAHHPFTPVAWSRLRVHHYWLALRGGAPPQGRAVAGGGLVARRAERAGPPRRAIRSRTRPWPRYAPAVREALARREPPLGAPVDRYRGAADRRGLLEHRKWITCAISAGWTHLEWSASGWEARFAGVSITLGRTALHRTPWSRYSAATAWRRRAPRPSRRCRRRLRGKAALRRARTRRRRSPARIEQARQGRARHEERRTQVQRQLAFEVLQRRLVHLGPAAYPPTRLTTARSGARHPPPPDTASCTASSSKRSACDQFEPGAPACARAPGDHPRARPRANHRPGRPRPPPRRVRRYRP